MANWDALFPSSDTTAVPADWMRDAIAVEKEKAGLAFADRAASMPAEELKRPVATLVAMGSSETFGGAECGMPFMGDAWLEERRRNPTKPLAHDGVEVIVNNVYKFDSGWMMLLRGHAAWRDIARTRGAYAAARAMFEARKPPHGENAVRQGLLDAFTHALAVRPMLGWKDRTLIKIESPTRGSLAFLRREVRPEEDVDDAFRAAVPSDHHRTRVQAMRFERDLPIVSFVKHVDLVEPGVLAKSDEQFTSVPNGCLYGCVNREGQELRDELRRQGYKISDAFALDPEDARAFILTV